MFRRHVHFRAFLPAAGLPALLTAIVILTIGGTALAAPGTPADPDGTHSFALPQLDFDGLDLDPLISTGDVPWWVDERDARYNRDRTVDWNHRFRPGRGAASLVTEFNTYKADERDNEAYLENARVIETFVTLHARGAIFPGLAVFAEVGGTQIQIRPDGDSGYDRYEYSYRFGVGFDTLGSLNNVIGFGLTSGFWAWEGRGHDSNNAQVTANGGQDVFLRNYLVRADARMVIELAGSPGGAYFNLEVGASVQYQWSRLIHDDDSRTLGFRQFSSDIFNLLGGLVLGVGDNFTLHAEVRLLGIVNGRLSLQLWW